MDVDTFIRTRERALDYLNTLEEVFVFDGFAGWEAESRIAVRVICGRAYHALFMHNMLIRPTPQELKAFTPDMTIINAGAFPCNRYATGMTSSTTVAMNLKHRELVILGTQYAGEMKKGVFSMMHYLMPLCGVLSLHAGCNIGTDGDVSLFFGLSGTGKTTLSTDPARRLIGDDEHCWGHAGVFNIEGGCYAKCIDLSPTLEPEIYSAVRFGAVVENVVFTRSTRQVDYADSSLTENTRAAYPIEHIDNAKIPCVGPHPANLILLCCDAFGVLPPVSRLTTAQAMYHFVSGYTAKVAGTEEGVTEPQATFSACFGGAFLIMHPYQYAALLAEKMHRHKTQAWLVNTGWTGGRYGVGHRMKLRHTRAIVDAIHSGALAEQEPINTPVFNLKVPQECPGVPAEVLLPANQWADPVEFMATLTDLGRMFEENFDKFREGGGMVDQSLMHEMLDASPKWRDVA
uniref:phosphoenolpyruvate carboxykinase (ATP) n=1 Tax=Pyramimonas obovata TaxID=1411642 RepID=A0A7S0MTU6_9CHLO|mmetsp:Transcript_11386/g.23789  ORF Transcript_11386/g.23789 Transcript_11386/m.23789 type:complete len:459 (+) Transcript_11386:612-1988(+)